MEKNKLISVIVPIYNVEKYLKKCVDSILNQTYSNLEVILVDDGSPDNCPEICDEYAKKDKRVKVIHKENGGVSSARNAGLDVATGDFIAFVDSDDFLEKDCYKLLIEACEKDECNMVIGSYNIVRNDIINFCHETELGKFCKYPNDFTPLLSKRVRKVNESSIICKYQIFCYLWRILFKRDVVENLRFYKDVKLREDVLFLIETILNNNIKIACVKKPVYNYVVREQSASHNIHKSNLENNINYFKHISKLLEDEKYKNLLNAIKFDLYQDCYVQAVIWSVDHDMSKIKEWNTRETYKASKKYRHGLNAKIKWFLIHHNYSHLLKLAYKVLNFFKKS